MTKAAAMPIYGKILQKSPEPVDQFQRNLASNTPLLQRIYKSQPCDDLDLFYGEKLGNRQMDRILIILKKEFATGVILIKPWGCIHVYDHYRHTLLFIYMYIYQISGERLQDHWSSGVLVFVQNMNITARPF